jgi:hypothetical protein
MSIPLPVISNTFRCAIKWAIAGGGQTAVNVIHIKQNTGSPTAAGAYTALSGGITSVGNSLWQSVANAASITEIDIIALDGVSGTVSNVTPTTTAFRGASTGDYVPGVAQLIKIGTGLRGRQHRGRIYLPFTAEAVLSSGSVSSATVTTQTAAWVALQAYLVGLSPQWSLGVAAYDRKHSGAGAAFTGMTQVTAESIAATQRRRQERLRGA